MLSKTFTKPLQLQPHRLEASCEAGARSRNPERSEGSGSIWRARRDSNLRRLAKREPAAEILSAAKDLAASGAPGEIRT